MLYILYIIYIKIYITHIQKYIYLYINIYIMYIHIYIYKNYILLIWSSFE